MYFTLIIEYKRGRDQLGIVKLNVNSEIAIIEYKRGRDQLGIVELNVNSEIDFVLKFSPKVGEASNVCCYAVPTIHKDELRTSPSQDPRSRLMAAASIATAPCKRSAEKDSHKRF